MTTLERIAEPQIKLRELNREIDINRFRSKEKILISDPHFSSSNGRTCVLVYTESIMSGSVIAVAMREDDGSIKVTNYFKGKLGYNEEGRSVYACKTKLASEPSEFEKYNSLLIRAGL